MHEGNKTISVISRNTNINFITKELAGVAGAFTDVIISDGNRERFFNVNLEGSVAW